MNTISESWDPNVQLFRARVGPALLANGDGFGTIAAWGFDGSDYQPGARILFVVDGEPGPNDMPGLIMFQTTPDGSNARIDRMTIKNDGKVGIGIISLGGDKTQSTHTDIL